jgi:SNF2 family DNA or RNA helicase
MKQIQLSAEFKAIIDVTNDLNNFIPYGLIFVTGFPGLPAPGLPTLETSSWKWLDFPYFEIDGMSPILKGLRLLVRRAYCRLTCKILDKVSGLALIRVYLMPADSQHEALIDWYRERYFKFKRPLNWLNKQCLLVLENLLTITDFSNEAFNLGSANKIRKYLSTNKIALVPFLSQNRDLETVPFEEIKYHLQRLVNNEPFSLYTNQEINSNSSIQTRLNNLYLNINSPSTNLSSINDENILALNDMIRNDEILGLKSRLYNFQKRSILKMLEKEAIQSLVLMPNILHIKNKEKHKFYFDIKKLLPVMNASSYLPPRGGILAENMGLGKTCICLALICLSKFEISTIPTGTIKPTQNKITSLFDICINFISQNSIPWKEYYDDFPSNITKKLEANVGYFDKKNVNLSKRNTRILTSQLNKSLEPYERIYLSSTTLIVLPDNLFHQWKVEIFKHIEKDYLNVLEIQTSKQVNIFKSMKPNQINEFDIVLISNSVFSKQFEISDSILKHIYWKRLIIDEGHSMNSKTSRAVLLTKDLMYERMWIISGTPTSGLTNLHVENESSEYTVQKVFDPKQDLVRLGLMVSNFFKIKPWCLNKKLWLDSIVKPFINNEFNIELQLSKLLEQLLIRHNIKDVEYDIKLPTLHHRPVFLKPCFFDKLSINLFISVLATNAITSERKGVDYMFDSSNKSDLRRLITNLQKGTFYWTGFSINDVENLLNICVYSLREHGAKYSDDDKKSLNRAIFISKSALSNMRWRAVTTVHEMGYFVKNLPKSIIENYSLVHYKNGISVYGYPHLISIQKFYYKNRIIKSYEELTTKIIKQSSEFWKGYWNSIKGSSGKSKLVNRPLSNKEEYKEFELSDVQIISQIPEWVKTFNPKLEEELIDGKLEMDERKPARITIPKVNKLNKNNVASSLRDSRIIGTLSTKLNYLTMRLLENQMKGIKSIVFYEFENSAYYLVEFLDLLGINYLMYSPYIKISERSNNLAQFDRWDSSKNEGEGMVLIMDLKLASHGLTIIAATQVFFINPVWNQSVEAQAIKRSHRIGQVNDVYVETLILENTLEEEMYNMRNEVKDTNNIELIDHERIKNYILTFPFLNLYTDESFDEEYSNLTVLSSTGEDLNTNVRVADDDDDDDVTLHQISSKFNVRTKNRTWNLPLFTTKNLDKLAASDSKLRKRRYDDIEELKQEEDMRKGESNNDKIKALSLLERLRNKRRCKRYVRFNV